MANHKGSFAAAADRDLMRAIQEAGQERWFTRAEKIEAAGALHPGGPIVVIESGFRVDDGDC